MLKQEQLKIAVFIDFDNIEIGVKTTLGAHFDVGTVLEAVKERGEIVTKIAYGDWTRAGDYGRAMSQHAIHMVQRNLTPGGDKNGADINLALDALEMAFTHSHINSFVIVSGDSDFISLVEKLKQYDRKVFVLGGRAFTSMVMQKNCTEFIAYENIAGRGRSADRGRSMGESNLTQAMPLVRRALKLLADREVAPQLGLLKSTLLQLDSAFSEREYGASSFRDFVQKLARAGYVTLKGSDRSFHVELREAGESPVSGGQGSPAPQTPSPEPAAAAPAADVRDVEEGAPPASAGLQADGFRIIQQTFQTSSPARWPLYIRQVKQLIKAVDPAFDERKYGFGGMVDALRYAQREGLFRLDRDRMGVVRVYPGTTYPRPATSAVSEVAAEAETGPTVSIDVSEVVPPQVVVGQVEAGPAALPQMDVHDAPEADGAPSADAAADKAEGRRAPRRGKAAAAPRAARKTTKPGGTAGAAAPARKSRSRTKKPETA